MAHKSFLSRFLLPATSGCLFPALFPSLLLAISALPMAGCSSPNLEWSRPDNVAPNPDAAFSFRLEPFVADVAAQPQALMSTAIEVTGHDPVALLEGELSDSERAAWAKGNPSKASTERQVPLTFASTETGQRLRPTRFLRPIRHTLLRLGSTTSTHTFDVVTSPLVSRLFPDEDRPSRGYVFCGGNASPTKVHMEPIGHAPQVDLVPLDSSCFEMLLPTDGTFQPPPTLMGRAWDPTPLRGGETAREVGCIGENLAGLCTRVDDDRIVLIGGTRSSFITLRLSVFAPPVLSQVLPARGRIVLRGLTPMARVELAARIIDDTGGRDILTSTTTLPGRRHMVINETLPRPLCGLPAQRFVELVNDGDKVTSLAGLRLRDGDTEHLLPSGIFLNPGEYLLIVGKDYLDGLGGEVPPRKGVQRVVVPSLTLTADVALVEVDDEVTSRMPKTSSTKTGARLRSAIDRPDDAPEAFGFGQASPGAPNRPEP